MPQRWRLRSPRDPSRARTVLAESSAFRCPRPSGSASLRRHGPVSGSRPGDSVRWSLPAGPARRLAGGYASLLAGDPAGKLRIRVAGAERAARPGLLELSADPARWHGFSVELPKIGAPAELELAYEAGERRPDDPLDFSFGAFARSSHAGPAAYDRPLPDRYAAGRSRGGVRLPAPDHAAPRRLLSRGSAGGKMRRRGELDAALARLALRFGPRRPSRRRPLRQRAGGELRHARRAHGGGRLPDARGDRRRARRSRVRHGAGLRPLLRDAGDGGPGRPAIARSAAGASRRARVSLSPHVPGPRLRGRRRVGPRALRRRRRARPGLAGGVTPT